MRFLYLALCFLISTQALATDCKLNLKADAAISPAQLVEIKTALQSRGYQITEEKAERSWQVLATSGALIGDEAKKVREEKLSTVNNWSKELFVAHAKVALVKGKITAQTINREVYLQEGSPSIFAAVLAATKKLPLCVSSSHAEDSQPTANPSETITDKAD